MGNGTSVANDSIDELMAALNAKLKEIDPVYDGRQSVVAHIAEHTDMDESDVMRVLQMMSSVTFPDAIVDYLRVKGASQEQVGVILIGIQRMSQAMVLQHCGLFPWTNTGSATDDNR